MNESYSRRIADNTAAYVAGQSFSRLFDILTILFLARYLGVDDFGKFSFAFAYVGVFAVVTDLGVNLILVRETAKSAEAGSLLYGSGITLKLLLACVGWLAAAGSILLLHNPPEIKVLVTIVSLNLLVSFRMPSFKDTFEVPLIARLKLKYSAGAAAANRVITFLAIIAAILLKAPLWLLTLVYTIISIPSFLLLLRFSRAVVRPTLRAKKSEWAYLLKEGLPLGLAGIFAIIYAQFDTLLLSRFWTMKEISLYSAARRVTEPLQLIPAALGLSILPIMSQFFARSKDEIIKIYRKSLLYMLLLAIPLSFLLMSFSRPIIAVLFGKEFRNAEQSLVILSCYLPFIFISNIATAVFIAIHKQKTNSLIWAAALALYFVLNLILIPRSAYVGASIVRLATGMFIAILSLHWAARYLGRMDLRFLARIGLLTVPLVAASRLLLASRPVLAFLFFVVLFSGGLFALKILGPEDMLFLKRSVLRFFARRHRDKAQD
jgi:O-antigen/teichoic acid export membrane protein